MPEQFALHQASGNCTAIYFNQRPALALAAIVNSPGNQLFTATCLAHNEDGRIGRGNRFHFPENVEQRRTIAHDLLKVVFFPNFFLQVNVLGLKFLLQRLDLF